jgi:hypothetical protein
MQGRRRSHPPRRPGRRMVKKGYGALKTTLRPEMEGARVTTS